MWETKKVGMKKVHIYKCGNGYPYIYWGVQERSVDFVESVSDFLKQNVENPSFTIAAYEASDWNAEFSPWSAPAVFSHGENDPGFAGDGKQTLKWLLEECIPFVERAGRNERYLAGYSLAGLFSIWAFYESQMFRGCVSGSGSLWFQGWKEYLQNAKAPEDSRVYLSLGGKEERTKNPVMATIGDATRQTKQKLEKDQNVTFSKLEWNPGGHFSEPDIRIAKGMQWLLEKHFCEEDIL